MNIDILKAKIEAILFASGKEVSVDRLMNALTALSDDYLDSSRGICLKEIGDSYILASKSEHYDVIANLAESPERFDFSDAYMETLSVIAYKQPVTRTEIEDIRGVGCSHIINKLIDKELIEEKGRLETPGRPILFGTTNEFLKLFNLKSLDDLPEVTEEFITSETESESHDNKEDYNEYPNGLIFDMLEKPEGED